MNNILVIGNSSGIGLEVTKQLLALGHAVAGISKSPGAIDNGGYRHFMLDVRSGQFKAKLEELAAEEPPFDACVYCAGIGEELDLDRLAFDVEVLDVNVRGAMVAAACFIPGMLRRKAGHIVVLSSLADELVSPDAPAYFASKAALSSYFEGLGLALRPKGVVVTNIRFGFVDTKMAKSPVKPFLLKPSAAAAVVVAALGHRRVRVSRPLSMALLAKILRFLVGVRLWCCR